MTTVTCIAQKQEPKLLGKLNTSITNLDTKLIDKLDNQYGFNPSHFNFYNQY